METKKIETTTAGQQPATTWHYKQQQLQTATHRHATG
jgi:hypothetical protein